MILIYIMKRLDLTRSSGFKHHHGCRDDCIVSQVYIDLQIAILVSSNMYEEQLA
ncbi:unnamed protein product [Brassica oleracea]